MNTTYMDRTIINPSKIVISRNTYSYRWTNVDDKTLFTAQQTIAEYAAKQGLLVGFQVIRGAIAGVRLTWKIGAV